MNFFDFILQAAENLRAKGWSRAGHNGTWPMWRHGGENMPYSLPAAMIKDLEASCTFQPVAEAYLLANGWRRVKHIVCAGLPLFFLEKNRSLPDALLEQLKRHRLDRNTPPTELRAVHAVGADR